MSLGQALVGNWRSLRQDAKGKGTKGGNPDLKSRFYLEVQAKSTNAWKGGGLARSSDEVSVIEME
jgi:hypothetical protein